MPSQESQPTPPQWARPSHHHATPRLILRSSTLSDAKAFTQVRSDPLNSEFGGVVNATYTVEQQEKALEREKGSTARGENAWLVVILKDGEGIEGVEGLRVEDGWLIGMTGYNSFPKERWSESGDGKGEKEVWVGDTGVLIDYHFKRRGYALETLEKVVEVGFEELGIDVIFLETNWGNEPFRGLMKSMGLGDLEKEGGGDGQGGRSVVYRFGKGRWEQSKERLRGEGKWYL